MTLSHYLESKLDPIQLDHLTRQLYKIRNRKTVLYDGTEVHIEVKSVQRRIDFQNLKRV